MRISNKSFSSYIIVLLAITYVAVRFYIPENPSPRLVYRGFGLFAVACVIIGAIRTWLVPTNNLSASENTEKLSDDKVSVSKYGKGDKILFAIMGIILIIAAACNPH